jgi:hypothetical protein
VPRDDKLGTREFNPALPLSVILGGDGIRELEDKYLP